MAIVVPNCHRDIPLTKLKEKYANEASRFISVKGMEVHYRDEGSGPILVLLHGTGASLHTWEGWKDRLSGDYRVIRMDLPAFGLTGPHPEADYSLDAYADFLHEFLNAHNIDFFHLGGNSLGGAISWVYALKYPKQVDKLILVDAAGHPFPSDQKQPMVFRLAKNPVFSSFANFFTPQTIHSNSLKSAYFNPKKVTPELVQRYFDLSLRPGNRKAFIDRIQQITFAPHERISEIKAPTLILWGQHDSWVPLSHGELFNSKLPNSYMAIYPDAGHVPMEEIPGKTARDVAVFLSR